MKTHLCLPGLKNLNGFIISDYIFGSGLRVTILTKI